MKVTVGGRTRHFRTVTYDCSRNTVLLIDQRLLPHCFQIISMAGFRQTAAAIRDMVVRGAGAIGATAAYGLAQGVRAFGDRGPAAFRRHTQWVYRILQEARPTAVDPVNAMDQVISAMRQGKTVEEQQSHPPPAPGDFSIHDVPHFTATHLTPSYTL